MGKITVETCHIEGLKVITPEVHGDARGYFVETYHKQAYSEAGITEEFLRNSIEQSLLQQALSAKVGTTAATDDEVISYLQGIKDRKRILCEELVGQPRAATAGDPLPA